ncbi:MAG TPA: elongation factor P [Candidatus Polarisedimenticolia bacterium]|nr:elongation factor P [Candidatus Polarisedimenticolia bacterium]
MAEQIKATGLKKGMCIKMNDELYIVMSTMHITPGNWRGMVQSKLRNLRSGNQMDHRFRSEDMVERVILDEAEMEFLYQDGDDFHFMNTRTYDQVHLHRGELGDNVQYLTPNLRLQVVFHETRPVGIELPLTVDMKVVSTAPELKGATASAQRKPAVTDTGLTVQVPPFIGEGEMIRISTEDGTYQERVK